MRQRLRTGLVALLALASTRAADAQPPAPGGPAGPGVPAARPGVPPRPAVLNQVLATVNGQPITRGDLLDFLSRFPVPTGDEKETYRQAVDYIANNRLIKQFLDRQRIQVTEKELADEIAATERKMKAEDNRDLKTALAESGHDLAWLREQVLPVIAWRKYINAVGTDANLKKFYEQNKDLFTRVQVRASHIFLDVPADAPSATKEAARQKLLAIKAEIEAGKTTFADAANKYSQDDANKTSPNGGDLGYFGRKGRFIDSFAAKAFAMPANAISEPFETEYGLHLILVTDRKPGEAFDFEQNRASVLNHFSVDLMERIINQEKKTAKIEVKEMPADLFQPAGPHPAPGATTPPAAGAGTSPAPPR